MTHILICIYNIYNQILYCRFDMNVGLKTIRFKLHNDFQKSGDSFISSFFCEFNCYDLARNIGFL